MLVLFLVVDDDGRQQVPTGWDSESNPRVKFTAGDYHLHPMPITSETDRVHRLQNDGVIAESMLTRGSASHPKSSTPSDACA